MMAACSKKCLDIVAYRVLAERTNTVVFIERNDVLCRGTDGGGYCSRDTCEGWTADPSGRTGLWLTSTCRLLEERLQISFTIRPGSYRTFIIKWSR